MVKNIFKKKWLRIMLEKWFTSDANIRKTRFWCRLQLLLNKELKNSYLRIKKSSKNSIKTIYYTGWFFGIISQYLKLALGVKSLKKLRWYLFFFSLFQLSVLSVLHNPIRFPRRGVDILGRLYEVRFVRPEKIFQILI